MEIFSRLLTRNLLLTPKYFTSVQAHTVSGKYFIRTFCVSTWSNQKMKPDFIFRQLFDTRTSTYTYILADEATKEAVIIDPVIEHAKRDVGLIRDLGLKLLYALNTHVHADHITGTGEIKKMLNETEEGNPVVPSHCRSVIAAITGAKADVFIKEGDQLKFGKFHLDTLSTPGHTDGCLTYVCPQKSMAFTGDALLIRGCGRTDFQQGSSQKLYESVHKKIFTLPDHYLLYPAHDYNGRTVTSVEEEKRLNPRLTKSLEEFSKIMSELNLPPPKYLKESLPANMVCGLYELNKVASDAKSS